MGKIVCAACGSSTYEYSHPSECDALECAVDEAKEKGFVSIPRGGGAVWFCAECAGLISREYVDGRLGPPAKNGPGRWLHWTKLGDREQDAEFRLIAEAAVACDATDDGETVWVRRRQYELLMGLVRSSVDERLEARWDAVLEERSRRLDGPQPRPNGPSFVYFIQGPPDGLIKIGTSYDVEKRRKDLQAGSPVALRVLVTTKGDHEDEHVLHLRFAAHRAHGEWFHPVQEILAHIAKLKERAA